MVPTLQLKDIVEDMFSKIAKTLNIVPTRTRSIRLKPEDFLPTLCDIIVKQAHGTDTIVNEMLSKAFVPRRKYNADDVVEIMVGLLPSAALNEEQNQPGDDTIDQEQVEQQLYDDEEDVRRSKMVSHGTDKAESASQYDSRGKHAN